MPTPASQESSHPAPKRTTVRRVFGLFALAACLSYAAGIFSITLYFKYLRGYPDVRYRDIALPHRWDRVNQQIGRHLIARAHEAFQRGEHQAGIHFLRAGLKKAPAHRDARWALVHIHLQRREYDRAQALLLDGLRHHAADPRYLSGVLAGLFNRQADEAARAVCDDILHGKYPSSPTTLQLASWGAANACYHRGRYDLATDYLARQGLAATREGRLLLARIEWERGYPELALNTLRSLAGELPGDEEIHLQLADCLQHQGLADERRRLLMLLALARPELPHPRVERIREAIRGGNANAAGNEADRLLREFSGNPAALLILGDFAAGHGDVNLAQRVQELLALDAPSTDAAALLVAEARANAGDFAGAVADLDGFLRMTPPPSPDLATAAAGLRTVACFGLGREAEGNAALQEFMARPGLRPANLQAVSRRLVELGAHRAAHDALLRAIALDPLNQAALTELIDLQLRTDTLAALPAHLRQLLTMRKPARNTLLAAQRSLGRDHLLFSPPHRQALLQIEAHLTSPPR